MYKHWILFSLFNFLVAALMGLILRGAFVWEISWLDYRDMMHGHSHVAMLGWVYMALYVLVGERFIPKERWHKPIYSRLFWFTQFTVVGMMVSFPLQGYGAISITFSSLHIIASYIFAYMVWRDHRTVHPQVSLLIKSALVLMLISTIGVWSLGPMALLGGRSSTLYQFAIQFYLHFQFHGWFTFCVLALLLDTLSRSSMIINRTFKQFYGLLLVSVILTYGLVLAWGLGGTIPLIINGAGVLFQLMALLLFFKIVKESNKGFFNSLSPSMRAFYRFGIISWIAKVLIQAVVLLPAAAVVSFIIRPFMIGFIHLTLLGFISGLVFASIYHLFEGEKVAQTAVFARNMFIIGFAVTELLLFVQGALYWFQWGQLPGYHAMLFAVSVLLPLSIIFIIISIISASNHKTANKSITN